MFLEVPCGFLSTWLRLRWLRPVVLLALLQRGVLTVSSWSAGMPISVLSPLGCRELVSCGQNQVAQPGELQAGGTLRLHLESLA